eukprot:1356823-Amorphochlora_amoeboformis.AAC.1
MVIGHRCSAFLLGVILVQFILLYLSISGKSLGLSGPHLNHTEERNANISDGKAGEGGNASLGCEFGARKDLERPVSGNDVERLVKEAIDKATSNITRLLTGNILRKIIREEVEKATTR